MVAGANSCNGHSNWMAFSPPARMAPKKNLYGTGVGIAVVGGDNSIQRHFGFVLWWGFTMVAGANSSTTLTTTLLQRHTFKRDFAAY